MEFSRRGQLAATTVAVEQHKALGKLLVGSTSTYSAQNSQLEGLYQEVDKLTKGKALVPTSDMLVELVNSSIADAKGLCYRDTYLDRLKPFVPAGDNPAYPDVLLALRVLQQTLARFDSMLKSETDTYAEILTELQTILAALQVAEQDEANWGTEGRDADADNDGELEDPDDSDEEDDGPEEEDAEYADDGEGDESGEGEEYEEYVTKQQAERQSRDGIVSDDWFVYARGGDYTFDFGKLDSDGLPQYAPPSEGITFVNSEK